MTDTDDWKLGETISATEVAQELQLSVAELRKMAERGEFPQMLQVTTRRFLIRKQEYLDWREDRWTLPQQVRDAFKQDWVRQRAFARKRGTA